MSVISSQGDDITIDPSGSGTTWPDTITCGAYNLTEASNRIKGCHRTGLSNPFLPLPHPAELNLVLPAANWFKQTDDVIGHCPLDSSGETGCEPARRNVTRTVHSARFSHSHGLTDHRLLSWSPSVINPLRSELKEKPEIPLNSKQEIIREKFSSQPESSGSNQILPLSKKLAIRESTSVLRAWLNHHSLNPYPTKGEKLMLALVTQMNLTQISTWFANARRRLKKDNQMTWNPRHRHLVLDRTAKYNKKTVAGSMGLGEQHTKRKQFAWFEETSARRSGAPHGLVMECSKANPSSDDPEQGCSTTIQYEKQEVQSLFKKFDQVEEQKSLFQLLQELLYKRDEQTEETGLRMLKYVALTSGLNNQHSQKFPDSSADEFKIVSCHATLGSTPISPGSTLNKPLQPASNEASPTPAKSSQMKVSSTVSLSQEPLNFCHTSTRNSCLLWSVLDNIEPDSSSEKVKDSSLFVSNTASHSTCLLTRRADVKDDCGRREETT
ncbi:hypothetical protein PHET_00722 [Paragonimus heterotremus]|uniref:Homeobox domain-containing protein n=1 Tax=Paragonimus heterotremus TaxID=100268 RepID=A0A8J4WLV3_9TREM|nr:hypothetical protein PHET_00722 [Paragonimus heterotremus]